MPPTQQVNAWANYDNTARTARRLQNQRPEFYADDTTELNVSLRRRKIRQSLASSAEFQAFEKLNDLEASGKSGYSDAGNRSQGWLVTPRRSSIFQDVVSKEGFTRIEDDDDDADQEAQKTERKKKPLSTTTIIKIRETFPVFFEEEILKPPTEASCIWSFLSAFNATMPWIQGYVESEFLLFIDTCLRGIGQVYFLNSPMSGLLVLIGLFIQSTRVAIHGLIGLVCGNLIALLLGFDKGLVRSGLFGYNPFLVGLALATFDSPAEYHASTILGTIVFSSFTSIIFVMLGELLVPYKSPPLTFPFVICTLMFLLATANMDRVDFPSVRPPSFPDYLTENSITGISASEFLKGSLRGIGQVYFAENSASGALVLAAIAVCSRILALAAFLGSVLGAGIAASIGVNPSAVAFGMFGFNASLSATAMLMFYNPSIGAGFLALFAGIMSVLGQQALASMLEPLGLPFMTLPFCVVALSFIIIQGTTPIVLAVPLADITVPEDHLHRVHMLEDGMTFLKESLARHETRRLTKIHSSKLSRSVSMVAEAIHEVDIAVHSPSRKLQRQSTLRKFLSSASKDEETTIKDVAQDIFATLVALNQGEEKCQSLTNREILDAFSTAGVASGEPMHLASLILGLMDYDKSNDIDAVEFVCFALVANAIQIIRRKLTLFFNFVDVDGNGSISFEEIDASLEYLGQSPLTSEEKQQLVQKSSMQGEYDEVDKIELTDIVTVEKVNALIKALPRRDGSSIGV